MFTTTIKKKEIFHNKKLPLDVQAFEIMRGEDYLYVDKTRYIYQMVTQGRYYFLSRPRRFGKSLLVSTLKCLFQGREELFKGLWIADHVDWDWKPHPVVLIDFSDSSNNTPERLERTLETTLHNIAEENHIELKNPFLQSKFKELILKLSRKTDMPVVVLFDEYDKPIIDHIGKGSKELEIARANRDVLKNFFGVLKSGHLAPILRFVFLTGISRFSRVSIFSELNNLNDISMSEKYAELLGYTQEELETCFSAYIQQLAEKMACSVEAVKAKLVHKYNGYRFSKKELRVYNPFSILKAFNEMELQDYWFETATPTFLVNFLMQERYNLPKLDKLKVSQTIFGTFELERLFPEAVLFQTGYLTITGVQNNVYTLDYPNQEVKTAFSESLFLALTEGADRTISSHVLQLAGHLQSEDFEAFFDTMTAIFASIPYTINTKRDEAYFHTIFYLMISASGADADCETLTSEGRIDLSVEFPEKVYIIEFKCNQDAETAIQQIRDKRYADRYRQSGKKIILIGINFSTEQRNLADWAVVQG
jgi:hypothetical protein